MQDFKNLRAWRGALSPAINVRQAANLFPRRGYTELKSQMSLMSRAYRILEEAHLRSLEEQTINVRRSVINLRKRVLATLPDDDED